MNDLISRQAAIEALGQIFDKCEEIEAHLPEGDPDRTGYKMFPDYMTVWKYLHQLPSAEPEQRNDYARGYNDAKREIVLSGEYERAYQRGKADAQQWIPCSERPPEIDKEVLVTDGEIYCVCSLFESPDIEDGLYQWEDNYGHWHEFETWVAWMPLPEPYKGEES